MAASRPDLITIMEIEHRTSLMSKCFASEMPWGDVYGGSEEASGEVMTPGGTFHANPSRPAHPTSRGRQRISDHHIALLREYDAAYARYSPYIPIGCD